MFLIVLVETWFKSKMVLHLKEMVGNCAKCHAFRYNNTHEKISQFWLVKSSQFKCNTMQKNGANYKSWSKYAARLGYLWYWSSILWSTDSCQNKVSADQYHMTISRAQVYSPSRSPIFLKLTADQVMVFSIWSRAHVFLNYINTKKWKGPLLGLA